MRRTLLLITLVFFLFPGFAQKGVVRRHLSDHLAKIASLTHKQTIAAPKGHTYYRLDTFGVDINYYGYINGTLYPYLRTIDSYDNYNYVVDALTKQYDLNSHNYVDIQEDIYARDANHNVVQHIKKIGYGNLHYDTRDLYVYDANNNMIVQVYQDYDDNTDNWVNSSLDSFFYNNRNLKTMYVEYNYDISAHAWNPSWKVEYSYDAFNNNTLQKGYYYNGSSWSQITLDSFYYQNGYLMRKVHYNWNFATSSWRFVMQIDYTYDANGNLLSEIDFVEDDTTYMEHNYYNAQNLLIRDTIWNRDDNSGSLIYSENTVYLYDSDNNPIASVSQTWDTTSNQWVNDENDVIHYNTNANFADAIYPEEIRRMFEGVPMIYLPTDILIKEWRRDSSTWMNMVDLLFKYKTIVTSIDNIANSQQITLYPNPASDVIHINLPEEQKPLVMIYDENGRVVRTTKLVTGQVSVKSLPTGTYFVVIRGKNQIYVAKFLKR